MSSINDSGDALDSLLQSCASIRRRARSTRTLTLAPNNTEAQSSGRKPSLAGDFDYALKIRKEQGTAGSLDRKMLDYGGAILRLQKKRKRATVEGPARVRHQRLLRSKVVDESLRQQQEKLLLSRMAMPKPARQVAFLAEAKVEDGNTRDQMILIQETVQARNKLVKQTLATQRELESVRKVIRLVSDEGRGLQKRTQEVWGKLRGLHDEQERERPVANGVSPMPVDTRRLQTETAVLKRALAEIIGGSTLLDWYSDQRIQATLLRLE